MKEIRITREILKNLKPSGILYAEYATGGAMGACGTARIYALEKDKLSFYLVDGIFDNKENESIYAETISLLKELTESGKLYMEYAGFGNYALKNPKIVLGRDDDNATFIYKKGDKTYKIPASCAGVYGYVVAKFAKREVPIEALEDCFRNRARELSEDEARFFEQYLEQIKLFDNGRGWFDMTPFDYHGAIKYLRHLSGEEYMLDEYDISQCADALSKYRLKYVVDKIGWDKLNKLFAQFVDGTNKANLSELLTAALGEPVNNIYMALETVHPEWKNLKYFRLEELSNLFDAPVLIDFSKATHNKILETIFELPGGSFEPLGREVGCYFANYLLNEDKLSLADALPAAMHVIESMPDDDFNGTHTDELFWLCGQIVDQAWRYLEEDDTVQKKYRQVLYEIYWPRVGSLWPVLNRNKFDFKREATEKIFNDAWSFVMSLEDIDELNAEIAAFLDANAEKISYKAGPLGRRCFVSTLKGLSSKDELDRILKEIEPDDYDSFLSYPSKIENAENLLAELFRTDGEARITGHHRLAVLEALVIRPNTIGVGEYILNYLNNNFDQFVDIVSMEAMSLGHDPTPVLTDFFIAMSMGVTEENEFPALKEIKDKLLKMDCDAIKLRNAEKYARRHRRTILFQRSALQKFF